MEDKTQVAKNLALAFNLSREIQRKNHEIPFHTYHNLKTKYYNFTKAEDTKKLKFSHVPGGRLSGVFT